MKKVLLLVLTIVSVSFSFRAEFGFQSAEVYKVIVGRTFADGEIYPVNRDGLTFGWDSSFQSNDRSRTTTKGPFAGVVFVPNTNLRGKFILDLPHTGQYRIRLFLCDPTVSQGSIRCEILDNVTPLDTIRRYVNTDGTIGIDTFVDINRNKVAFADTSLSLPKIYNFTSTKLVIWIGNDPTRTGSTNISRIIVDDNVPTGCDTITNAAIVDSTDSSLTFNYTIYCDGMDSTGTVYGYDTLHLDTVWHVGPFTAGTVIRDTIAREPSSKSWFRAISDSVYKSPWYSAWTLNDTDSLIIDTSVTTPDTITITTQPTPDTAVVGQPMQFSVSATSDIAFTQGWYKGGVFTGDYDSVYNFTTTVADNGKYVRWVGWNNQDTVWSDSARINVIYAVFDSIKVRGRY